MGNAEFLSKVTTYEGDYNSILRTPKNEFMHGLHYHDFYELVIYLDNAGIFRIDDGEYLIRRGDLVLIDMFKPHELLRNKNSSYQRFSISVDLGLLISFSTASSNLLDLFHKSHPIFHLEEDQLKKYVALLQEHQRIRLNNDQDILEKALIHQILAYAYNDCYSDEHLEEIDSQHLKILSQLLNYISSHLNQEIALADLAEEVNYSEYYVCRLFKKLTGKTLTNYIQEKRIEQVAYLLRTYDSVNQAAEQAGFNNYSYFYKTFKKFMGCSPAEYQAKFREKNS